MQKTSIWKKIFNFVGRVVDVISASLCGIMFALIAYQIVSRTIFGRADAKTDEIVGYLFIWVVYFGMILAAKDKEHIAVTVVTDLFRPRLKLAANMIAHFIWTYFTVYVSLASIKLVKGLIAMGGRTPILRIGLGYLYLIMPIAFIWSLIYIIRDIVDYIKELAGKKEIEGKDVNN